MAVVNTRDLGCVQGLQENGVFLCNMPISSR